MKKLILTLIVILVTFQLQAQENQQNTESQSKQSRKEIFRFYAIIPQPVGNNVLAKAHDGKTGFGVALTLANIERVQLSVGYEYTPYGIAAPSLAGNADKTNVWQAYLHGQYKIPLNNHFDINPGLSIGQMVIAQKKDNERFGDQYGFVMAPGVSVDFTAVERLRFFIGVNYNIAFMRTNTNPEYEKFFSRINVVNISAGIKI